jgi:hypothetical protein
MYKMGLHDPFGHFKHKLWPKEGPGVKLAIWLPTTKSQESPRFLHIQVTCNISLKVFQRGLQLCFRSHLNQRSARKIMGPQSHRSPSCENFGSLTTKWHLGVGPMARHIVYYKGEGGGFFQVQAVVNLMSPSLPMARPSTKNALAMH